MSKLVIVESPAKIKSLGRYLPKGFDVASSVGHIRDLPGSRAEIPDAVKDAAWADLGVNYEDNFDPVYVVIRGKGKVITELKKKLKGADELYLATDEDREGESISWHLVQALKPKVPVKRMTFIEITREAIEAALANPRELNMDLVQAQETRRILDRLVGYSLSPLLWRKIGGNLSAGRVQSVAVRMVVQRERERRAFRAGRYWDLEALLDKTGARFGATLTAVGGRKVATSKDFDKDTGRIAAGRDVVLLDEAEAKRLEADLMDATWQVVGVESSRRRVGPPPPFITSTLQQEANNRFNLSARDAMRVAQRLYESGLITYMRTDSTHLSTEALTAARSSAQKHFGAASVADKPRTYADKKARGAQEAHEAIRPAGSAFVEPRQSGLTGRDLDLYTLIWQRTVATQMVDEVATATVVEISAGDARFTARGRQVEVPGFRLAYPVTGESDPPRPPMAAGDRLDLVELDARFHETKPPARYTEATLVRALEEGGVGRPSTYAEILGRIMEKGYVVLRGKALVPTFTAFAVTALLEEHFPDLVDTDFTASMEATLDKIAAGEADWLPYLRNFFLGESGLKEQVDRRMQAIEPSQARVIELDGLPVPVRIGRFGPYLELHKNGERISVSIPPDVTPDELDEAKVAELLAQKEAGPDVLGTDPATGLPVLMLTGRFGPYVQLGEAEGKAKPPRASIPRGVAPESLTLDEALFLLSLPRELGPHPDGGTVLAGLGRYGPYVAHDPGGGAKLTYQSLPDFDSLRTVDLAQGLAALQAPKAGGRGGRGARTVISELGAHPADGQPVRVLSGRYGPYVNHGKVNATIPRGQDPESLKLDQALSLLEAKAAKS